MLRSIGRQRSRSMTRRNTIFTPSRSYLYDISITGSLVKMEVNTKHWESHFSKGFSTGLYRSTRTSTSKHPAFEDGCSSARKIVAVNTPTDKRSIISCAFWKGPCVYYPALEKKKKTQKNVWVMSSLWPSTPFFSCCILPGLPHLQELRASLTITHPQITGRARTQSVPLPVSFWWVLFELCPTIQTRDTHRDSRASLVCLSE